MVVRIFFLNLHFPSGFHMLLHKHFLAQYRVCSHHLLPQRHLLPAAKKGEGGTVQCSPIYPFQSRFDLENNQSQLPGYQKPNKLFYCLIIHIIQNQCKWQLPCFCHTGNWVVQQACLAQEHYISGVERLLELLVFNYFILD